MVDTPSLSAQAPSVLAVPATGLAPSRVSALALSAVVGIACFTFLGYLWRYEDTWMNRVVAATLLLPFVMAIYLVSRRGKASLILGIAFLVLLAVASDAKYQVTTVAVSVFDLLLLDFGTITFAMAQDIFFWQKFGFVAFGAIIVALIWWEYPVKSALWKRLGLFILSLAGFLSIAFLQDRGERSLVAMNGDIGQLSYFAKSLTHLPGYFQDGGFMSRADPNDPLLPAVGTVFGSITCAPTSKPPHIIVISDESNMDTTRQPSLAPDTILEPYFASFDGKRRKMESESYGGSTWFAETSVLTGLSTRGFGAFAPIVTRLVGRGHVEYNLPTWLAKCGYRSLSLYPSDGRFAGANVMHAAFGVTRFVDKLGMGFAKERQRDRAYYEQMMQDLEAHKDTPLFTFIWTTSNHFGWDFTYEPGTRFEGIPPSPTPEIAEYRRRQRMVQLDHTWLIDELKNRFPNEKFVILRYGDHQPYMGMQMVAPDMPKAEAKQRVAAFDLPFYTTYYAFDLINTKPAAALSPFEQLAVPYLGGQLLALSGLPLHPVAAYEQDMLERCKGAFATCDGGKEMNRFNAWLVREGYVRGL